jgi:hypothetical protein
VQPGAVMTQSQWVLAGTFAVAARACESLATGSTGSMGRRGRLLGQGWNNMPLCRGVFMRRVVFSMPGRSITVVFKDSQALALQLHPSLAVGLLRHGLVTSSPSGPGDDEGGLDLALS